MSKLAQIVGSSTGICIQADCLCSSKKKVRCHIQYEDNTQFIDDGTKMMECIKIVEGTVIGTIQKWIQER